MTADQSDPDLEGMRAVRRVVQEIITTQVVLKDRDARDRLIDEAIEEFGEEVVQCTTAFVYAHAADDVDQEVANDRFYFLLSRLGAITEVLAEVRGIEVADAVMALASIQYEWDEDDPEGEESEEAAKAVVAARAAQTCLIANHFIRRGAPPWGIQDRLDLGDMCAVVDFFGFMLFDVIDHFEKTDHARLVRLLLEDVETILRAMARAKGSRVSELVSTYFTALAQRDLE